MKLVRQISLLIALCVGTLTSFAQFDTEDYDSSEYKILYNRLRSFGVIAHSHGLGIQYRTGKRITYFKSRVLEFSFVSMRSYKQVRVHNPIDPNARRYIYGKENEVFFLRGGFSWKRLLNRKPYWGGVELRLLYGGGITVGIAKPYYLYTAYLHEGPGNIWYREIRTEQFSLDNQTWDYIYGRAPFTKGFGEIALHPGLYGKIGLNFEFGKKHEKIQALEAGAQLDVLPTGISVMYNNPQQIFFPSVYLSFSFGKRFNKY